MKKPLKVKCPEAPDRNVYAVASRCGASSKPHLRCASATQVRLSATVNGVVAVDGVGGGADAGQPAGKVNCGMPR